MLDELDEYLVFNGIFSTTEFYMQIMLDSDTAVKNFNAIILFLSCDYGFS